MSAVQRGMKQTAKWAGEEFGQIELADVRRVRRAVRIAALVAERPSGTVSSVFSEMKDREGAYDFLENPHVSVKALAEGMFGATAKRAARLDYAYVAIDGSSLSMTDRTGEKGFGPINTRTHKARGLLVNSALLIAPNGTPLGLIDQKFWSRGQTPALTTSEVVARNKKRAFEEKEPAEMLHSARRSIARLAEQGVRAWIVIDRNADNQDILEGLVDADCSFCVRANYDRYLNDEERLRETLATEPVIGSYRVAVGRTAKRAARTADLELRSRRIELPIRRGKKQERLLSLTAVWVREKGVDKDALDWIIYTNEPVITLKDGLKIIEAYRTRWRIEEFHRTWKDGKCGVEDAQLQSAEALQKWATLLAAVATRIERLKYSSRHHPDELAVSILSPIEVEVMQTFHRNSLSKPPKAKPVAEVTVVEVTEWIASMGGWMGRSHGLPGSVTLGRGLERLQGLVQGFQLAQATASKRRT